MKFLKAGLWCMAVALLAVLVPWPLLAQDSTAVINPSAPVGSLASIVIGLGAAALTGLVGGGAAKVDKAIGSADGMIRDKAGPVLPLVAMIIATYAPKVIPGAVLDPSTVVNAPLAALSGVVGREVLRKWILPVLGFGKKKKG